MKKLGVSRFKEQDLAHWFDTLKRLTHYNSFKKRDGSIASRCLLDGKVAAGQ